MIAIINHDSDYFAIHGTYKSNVDILDYGQLLC